MSVNFYRRPIEDNEWDAEVCGISFKDKVIQAMGQAAAEQEVWTAWVDVEESAEGEGYTEQITQENCQLAVSDLDDDSDTILYRDRRDDLWFRFTRLQHPEIFDWVASTVAPWAMKFISLIPIEVNYNAMLKQMTTDVESFEVPDDWVV